jgi:hypothetical protein
VKREPSRGALLALAIAVGLFCAAPVPGDVGGCGQTLESLDAPTFFASKKRVDCERCTDCSLISDACQKACDPKQPIAQSFPVDCYPLVHDGEVCLDALDAASCSDYAGYMDDQHPTTPSECDFCPLSEGP